MKLVRVQARTSAEDAERATRYAVAVGEERLGLLPSHWALADALAVLMADASEGDESSVAEWVSADEWSIVAPVPSPASVRDFVGFFQHIRNSRRTRGDVAPLLPVWKERPGFYYSNPYGLRSATDDIAIPAGSTRFDLELEIAAVIGKGGRDLTAAEAGEAIAGYVLFCDWSARDIQSDERALAVGMGKAKDAAVSLGPWILSAAEAATFRQPGGLDIPVSAHVNEKLVTDPETRYIGMDWTFEEIVAYSSVGVDLVAGDVIAAGTVPTGCLLEHSADEDFGGWLAAGDTVRITAGPLGEISATILGSESPTDWRRA